MNKFKNITMNSRVNWRRARKTTTPLRRRFPKFLEKMIPRSLRSSARKLAELIEESSAKSSLALWRRKSSWGIKLPRIESSTWSNWKCTLWGVVPKNFQRRELTNDPFYDILFLNYSLYFLQQHLKQCYHRKNSYWLLTLWLKSKKYSMSILMFSRHFYFEL